MVHSLGLVLLVIVLFGIKHFTPEIAARIVSTECVNKEDYNRCYADSLRILNSYTLFNFSIETLKVLESVDPRTGQCSHLASTLAESEVAKNPDRWLSVIDQIPSSHKCMKGFIHGMIKGKQKFDQSFKLDSDSANKICSEIKDANANWYRCGNAIGRVVMVEKKGDFEETARFCSVLQEQLIRPCLDGLFTEGIFKTNLVENGLATAVNISEEYAREVENTCKGFQGEKATSCWRELSVVYYELKGPNFKQIKEYCQRGILNANTTACYFRIISVVAMDKNFDKKQLSDVCTDYLTDQTNLTFCYDWLITGLIYHGKQYIPLVDDVCNSAPAVFQNQCWKMKEKSISTYLPKQ